MKQRELPPVGGGPPVIASGGRVTALRRDEKPAPLTLTLSVSEEAKAAGADLLVRIRDACARDDIELVGSIVVLFPSVATRAPDFHALLDELVRDEKHDTIARIFRVPGRRGPKRQDEFHLVALIEHVMRTEHIDRGTDAIARLAEILAEERAKPITAGEQPVPFLPGAKALGNRHSRLHELFALWSNGVYVPGEELTAMPWLPPGYAAPPPSPLVMTRLSNAIVFHAPEDTVTEPKKEQ